MTGYIKTSGNRGLHVYVRLLPTHDSIAVRSAAVAVARELERRHPALITASWWKEERGARIFIDFNQNAPHKTVFAPWSVRALDHAPVSFPFPWDLLPTLRPHDMTIASVPTWVAEHGDAWATMSDSPQSIEPFLDMVRSDQAAGLVDAPWPPVYPKMEGEPIARRAQSSQEAEAQSTEEEAHVMPALPIADHWFERTTIDDSITLLWEPHVIPLMRCNIWHLRGRDRDLVVDTGMGFMSLSDELAGLVGKTVTAVATHGHDDHIGGHHEFADVLVHPTEAPLLLDPPISSLKPREAWGDDAVDALEAAGYPMQDPYFVTALPAGMAMDSFHQEPVAHVRHIDEGDEIDLGDRCFEVIHLPGHSPGSIGLWGTAHRNAVLG